MSLHQKARSFGQRIEQGFFCNLHHSHNLTTCVFHIFAKENPEVIDESVVNSADDEDASDNEDGKERTDVQGTSEDTRQTDLISFLLFPPSLLREHKNDRANKKISYKRFKHVTNYVVHEHWNNDVGAYERLLQVEHCYF